jgi:hypothetical protein
LSVPDEGYFNSNLSTLSVPDEGYSNLSTLSVPDEGYSNLSTLSVPDEGYSRNTLIKYLRLNHNCYDIADFNHLLCHNIAEILLKLVSINQ